MKTLKILLFYILSIFFIACNQTQSVDYYQKHPDEAKKRSDECRLKSIISQDCVNAHSVAIPKEDWEENKN